METKKKKKKEDFLIVVLLLLSVTCLFFGISMAVFSYLGNGNTNNVIQTGRIVFSYSDAESGGNGINITDAIPISDTTGKQLTGDGQFFDFSVTASTTSTDLAYEIVAKKDDTSTLPDDYVKLYLTERVGTSELTTPITGGATVPTYSSLSDTTNPTLSGKSIYYGTVQAGEVAYGKNFRLRMWVKDPGVANFDYDSLNDKFYKVKVNVSAVGSNN